MALKKKLKRRTNPRKPKLLVDPSRLALAALERIKSLYARTDRLDKLGEATPMRELAARAAILGRSLPPSYVATLRMVSSIGEPEMLLVANEMTRALKEVAPSLRASDVGRYLPFAAIGKGRYAAFDRTTSDEEELAVVQLGAVTPPRPLARHFGEWLDEIADEREESIHSAAVLPEALRDLLLELGFRFDDPIVGRLETGDVAALEELLGEDRAREIRGDADRLFDSSGKASLTLNVDEFSLAVSLRTGIFVFPADEVFQWLRGFRDENFFGEPNKKPGHPDYVRDLSKAPREPPLVLRGCIEVRTLPARRHTFRAASGRSADDFYMLGRTSSTSDRAPSVILHVTRGQVRDAHALDEPLNDLYVTNSGTMWGLSLSGTAVRFSAGVAKSYSLNRPTRGRPWWYGIGGDGDRVLVWGAGALLELRDDAFVPFSPDAELAESEAVLSLCANKREIQMLVCGDRVGAVARYNGTQWLPISEDHVVDGMLNDLDVWRGIGIVLSRTGDVWRVDDGPPRPVVWDRRQQAFLGEGGTPRPTHSVRGFDGGALLASDGGTIVVGSGEPVFYSAGLRGPARLARVGTSDSATGIVSLCGPHAWLWRNGTFEVLDVRDW